MAYAAKSLCLTDPAVPFKKRSRNRMANRNMETRMKIHIKSLNKFYSNEEHFNTVYRIVNQKTVLSLRLLEFVCTHIAKQGLVLHVGEKTVYLDSAYQDRLDSQGKVFFDPFRRNPKSRFIMEKFDKELDTNIAQLRFFKFAIRNGVIKYATENFRTIEAAMSEYTAHKRLTGKKRGHTNKDIQPSVSPKRTKQKNVQRNKKKRKMSVRVVQTSSVELTFSPSRAPVQSGPIQL